MVGKEEITAFSRIIGYLRLEDERIDFFVVLGSFSRVFPIYLPCEKDWL